MATDWGTVEPPSPNAVDHFSQVEAALRLAYTALNKVQHRGVDSYDYACCPDPDCEVWPDGHSSDCTLAAALAAIRALLPDVDTQEG